MKKARLFRLAHALLAGPSSDSSRTSDGRYEPIAGEKKAEKQVARMASPTMTKIGASNSTAPAMSSMISPRAMSVVSSTRRRS